MNSWCAKSSTTEATIAKAVEDIAHGSFEVKIRRKTAAAVVDERREGLKPAHQLNWVRKVERRARKE